MQEKQPAANPAPSEKPKTPNYYALAVDMIHKIKLEGVEVSLMQVDGDFAIVARRPGESAFVPLVADLKGPAVAYHAARAFEAAVRFLKK